MNLHAGMCMCECTCLQRPEAWGPLELQLQAVGTLLTGAGNGTPVVQKEP